MRDATPQCAYMLQKIPSILAISHGSTARIADFKVLFTTSYKRQFDRYKRQFGRYKPQFGRYKRQFGRYKRQFGCYKRQFGRYKRQYLEIPRICKTKRSATMSYCN